MTKRMRVILAVGVALIAIAATTTRENLWINAATSACPQSVNFTGTTVQRNGTAVATTADVPTSYSSTPASLGTANAGDSANWARGNHVHAMPSAADVGAATAAHNHTGTYQPADADLTTWAGISPSANIQTFLGAADYAAARTALQLGTAATTAATDYATAAHNHTGVYQAADADLTTWAGISPSANIQTFLGAADYAAARTALQLGTAATTAVTDYATAGHNHTGVYQAADADLTTWAGITPSSDGQSLVALTNYAAMYTALGGAAVGKLATMKKVIPFTFDGGGSAIAEGSFAVTRLPSAFRATQWSVIASTSSSITFAIAVDNWSTSALPTTDVIGAHTAPALSSAIGATATPDWSDVDWASGQIIKVSVTDTTPNPTAVWAVLLIEGTVTE